MLNPEISLNRRPIDLLATNAAIAALAERWQPVVRAARDRGGPAVKNVLDGTIVGHPLHPVLTDVPVGGWTVTALLDTLEVFGRPDVAFAADASLLLGLGGAVAAVVTGYADWSDTKDEPRTLGMAHAMLNAGATAAYVASFALRRAGNRGAGIATAFAGYGLMSLAAYLGGELSYDYGIGMKHTAEPLTPPADFIDACAFADVADGTMKRVEAGGLPVLLYRAGDDVHAVAAICTHRGAPLDTGSLEGDCVRCPWHASVFAFADGSVREGPASFPLAQYETQVTEGRVRVRALRV